MKNIDALEMLNNIQNFLNKEEYQKADDYIQKKKLEIQSEKDLASEYIDKLVKNMK